MNSTNPALDERNDVQASIERNNRKLTADKIISILNQVRNDKAKSNRRWIWELMQNAKDLPVPKDWGGVSIEIEYLPDQLTFRHNADPFRVADLTGLIQQVSSKASDSSDNNVTGKFGTGFISTHLLSAKIKVAGVVKRPHIGQHRRFQILLDRSGNSSEDLLIKLSSALDQVLLLDQDPAFELIEHYDAERTENDLDTSFTYDLVTGESQESARVGLADLVHTLPATLVNLPKIKQVRVLMPNGTEQTYRRVALQDEEDNDAVSRFEVVQTDSGSPTDTPSRYFVTYETDSFRLLAEVSDFSTWKLVYNTGKQPMLYRDFPLIGSEKFYYPFTLNGYHFFPNERRDSVFLNGTEGVFQANRDILEAAQIATIAFTDWLIKQGATNRFVLATTRLPEADLDDDTKKWYRGLQRSWRANLLSKPLVETEAGTTEALLMVRIPRFTPGSSDEIKVANAELYELVADYLGPASVPRHDLQEFWISAIGPESELNTWGDQPLFINVDELLEIVSGNDSLLAMRLGGDVITDEVKKLSWLNRLYTFLARYKKLDLLKTYSVVPNQKGDLRNLDKLWVERPDELIPAPILDVLDMLDLPWREDLIPRNVHLPGYKHQDRGLSDASKEINKVLNTEEKMGNLVTSDFLSRSDAQTVLVSLLRLTTAETRDNTYRSRLFGYAEELLHLNGGTQRVESLEGFHLGNAAKLFTRLLNQRIEICATLVGLSNTLYGKNDVEAARKWLNDYLVFLDGSAEYKHLIEDGNIVPNRLDILCSYDSLHNYGTPGGQMLDDELLDILHQFNPLKLWPPRLLANGIQLALPKVYKMEELGNELVQEADSAIHYRRHQEFRIPLLSLIEWCETHEMLARTYLGQFVDELGGTFYKLTIEKSDKSKDVMRLLRKPEQLSDLVAIADSNINLAKLRQLVELEPNDILLSKALNFVREQQIEDASFATNFAIGQTMEQLFREALLSVNIPATIQYQGKGDCDYLILNTANEKCFFIEVKSYVIGSKRYPLRMALSQATLAVQQPEKFALCVIPHPLDLTTIDAAYVKRELVYVPGTSGGFEQVIEDWIKLQKLSNQQDQYIALEVTIEKPKVRVSHGFIDDRGKSFADLVRDIIKAIN
ncbi:sacsin N-terminal ATP-binding-like domain-containing protein [Spirosoma sordidisoli]|uniref:ATP-binding protein n=1 Tax=Spirosoma sordidisoli TaxID=2502893 RepID=A0A4V1RWE9_9BACT|nr:hypothetical protein [Spirosoma sordidisoli]RYC70028.1 hypothetical protein EQG79_09155 [Spirosoma sordidisoli]